MRCLNRNIALSCMLAICISLLAACTDNSNEFRGIFTISSDDPQIGFWVAFQANENIAREDTPYVAEISFGTRARNLECFEVTVVSEDFEITKSCEDIYIVDGEKYTDDDFYVVSTNEISPVDLPQKFILSLTKKTEKEVYSGEITIIITEHLTGGYSTGSITLFYYGDGYAIYFSTVSTQDAKQDFDSQNN